MTEGSFVYDPATAVGRTLHFKKSSSVRFEPYVQAVVKVSL